MDVFKDQLSESWESSESMMYVADILRESGAIRQPSELVIHAGQLSPTCELLHEHNKAFLVTRDFMNNNLALKIGNISFSQMVPFL